MRYSARTDSRSASELRVNGVVRSADVDTRVTLLDALRNNFQLPGEEGMRPGLLRRVYRYC